MAWLTLVFFLSNPDIFPLLCERGCGKRFKSEVTRAIHCRTKCPVKLICATCSESFSSKRKFELHRKRHAVGTVAHARGVPLLLDGAGDAPLLLDGASSSPLLLDVVGDAAPPHDVAGGDAPSRHLDVSSATPLISDDSAQSRPFGDLNEFCNNHLLVTDMELPAFDAQLGIEELNLSFDLDMDLITFLKS